MVSQCAKGKRLLIVSVLDKRHSMIPHACKMVDENFSLKFPIPDIMLFSSESMLNAKLIEFRTISKFNTTCLN